MEGFAFVVSWQQAAFILSCLLESEGTVKLAET